MSYIDLMHLFTISQYADKIGTSRKQVYRMFEQKNREFYRVVLGGHSMIYDTRYVNEDVYVSSPLKKVE